MDRQTIGHTGRHPTVPPDLLDLNVVVLRRVQLAQHVEVVGADLDRPADVAAARAARSRHQGERLPQESGTAR
jgi:hypothetical protein